MKQLFPRGKRIRPTDKDLVFSVYPALHVFSRSIVDHEYAILSSGFYGHVGNAESVVHGQVSQPFSHEFK